MNNKAQGLSLNVIIIASIALLVLLVLVLILLKNPINDGIEEKDHTINYPTINYVDSTLFPMVCNFSFNNESYKINISNSIYSKNKGLLIPFEPKIIIGNQTKLMTCYDRNNELFRYEK